MAVTEASSVLGLGITFFLGSRYGAVWAQNWATPHPHPTPTPMENRQKMIDCHVLTRDGATLETHWLHASPKPATAYRQCEQWDTVSLEIPCSTLLKENETEQVSLK